MSMQELMEEVIRLRAENEEIAVLRKEVARLKAENEALNTEIVEISDSYNHQLYETRGAARGFLERTLHYPLNNALECLDHCESRPNLVKLARERVQEALNKMEKECKRLSK